MTQSRRRLLVVATWTSYLLAGAVAYSYGRFAASPLFLASGATACVLTKITRIYGLGMRRAELALVDERMTQMRTTALARSYGVLSLLLLCAVAGWLPVAATNDQQQYLFWGALLVVSTLPNALLAWSEPDSPAENDGTMTEFSRS